MSPETVELMEHDDLVALDTSAQIHETIVEVQTQCMEIQAKVREAWIQLQQARATLGRIRRAW
jgi:hypothetical protein